MVHFPTDPGGSGHTVPAVSELVRDRRERLQCAVAGPHAGSLASSQRRLSSAARDYRVKVASAEKILGYLLLGNAAAGTGEFDWLAGTSFDGGILGVLASNLETGSELVDQWVRVELRNIDWSTRTYDLYVNCTRLGEAVGLPAGLGDTIDRIDVYNYPYMTDASSIAWYDDILIK